jgi:hypothetical protein
LHELGHSLKLYHTHSSDGCSDTISDNQNWNKDQIATNNFGCTYNNCTASQQAQVDLVFNNVMSYHVSEPQLRLSGCQLDRVSTQGDSDRGWLLSKQPVYVNSSYVGFLKLGRFTMPFNNLQTAVNSGVTSKVIVLQSGSYLLQNPITTNTTIVTRDASSTVDKGVQLWTLPADLENSKTPEVRNAALSAQNEDRAARKAVRDAKAAAKLAKTAQEKASIMSSAAAAQKMHEGNALNHLINAEKFASGKEKVALEFELGQRYRDAGNCAEAVKYFDMAAKNTVQKYLKERLLYEIKKCREKMAQ